jgi:hypothetical protein
MRLAFGRHPRRALETALAVGVIAGVGLAPAAAQGPAALDPRAPRITIMRSVTSTPPPPPPPPTTLAAARTRMFVGGGGYDIERWLDRSDAPASLTATPRGTVVLARDLALSDLQYTLDTPLLVVVAESIRITGKATIDLSGRVPGKPAGALMLLAKRIACERGGALQVISKGGAAQGSQPGSSGGDLTLAPAPAGGGLPPCISHVAAGGAGAEIIVRDHRGPKVVETKRTVPGGPPGKAKPFPDLGSAAQADALARTAWSLWTVERLENLSLALREAERTQDDQRQLKLFREYEGLNLPGGMIDTTLRKDYLALLDDLNKYRDTALPPLFVEELTVQPTALPQSVSVFTEGATLRSSLAPTHALVVRENVAGRSVLGLLEYRNDHPDELAIEVWWELTVDPWIERLAAAQRAAQGEHLGVFSGWSLEAKPMQELGVRSGTARLEPGGRRLQLRLVVDAERANLVFWRLLNSGGLPWSVDWRFIEPKTGRVVNGSWAGPPLSLARQRDPQVRVAGNEIVNAGTSPATVNYLQLGDGSFWAPSPALRVNAGEKVPIPSPPGATRGAATLPPEAVETAFDPATFSSDFYVLNGDQVVDRVVIKNALPTSDDARGAFDYLEVSLTTSVPGGTEADTASAGPFRLSASGTLAAETSIPLLRFSRGARQVTLAGRAYYAGGSYRTLKTTTFDTTSIIVTPDLFQSP